MMTKAIDPEPGNVAVRPDRATTTTYKLIYYPETRLSAEWWVVVQWNGFAQCWDSVLGLGSQHKDVAYRRMRALTK